MEYNPLNNIPPQPELAATYKYGHGPSSVQEAPEHTPAVYSDMLLPQRQQHYQQQQYQPPLTLQALEQQTQSQLQTATSQHRPQEEEGEMKACPHPDCSVKTRYMELHLEHIHTRKFWGYRCLDLGCRAVFNAVHKVRLREHWEQEHSRRYISDHELKAFKVKILEGYYDLVKCDLCNYTDFNEERILQHKGKEHSAIAVSKTTSRLVHEERFHTDIDDAAMSEIRPTSVYGETFHQEINSAIVSRKQLTSVHEETFPIEIDHTALPRKRPLSVYEETFTKIDYTAMSGRRPPPTHEEAFPKRTKPPQDRHYETSMALSAYEDTFSNKIDHAVVSRRRPPPFHEETFPKRIKPNQDRQYGTGSMHDTPWPENGSKSLNSDGLYGYKDYSTTRQPAAKIATNHTSSGQAARNVQSHGSKSNNPTEKQSPSTTSKKRRCPHQGCGAEVSNLKIHVRRVHTLKYTAFRCPECKYHTSILDATLFRKHMLRSHGKKISDDMERFVVDIPKGYYGMTKCQNCRFIGLTQDDIITHQCQPQNEMYDYVGATTAQKRQPDMADVPRRETMKQNVMHKAMPEQKTETVSKRHGVRTSTVKSLYHMPKPTILPPEKITEQYEKCPSKGCKAMVKGMRNHMKRYHTRKYKGFQCDECGNQWSILDRSYLRQHLREVHGMNDPSLDTTPFEVDVPSGYREMYECNVCKFRAFTEDYIIEHVTQKHANLPANEPTEEQRSDAPAPPASTLYPQAYPDPSPSNPVEEGNAETGDKKLVVTIPPPDAPYKLLEQPANPATITESHRKCPEEGCNAMVHCPRLHRKRWHTAKYTGYQCDQCGSQFSILDRGHLRKHLSEVHGMNDPSFDCTLLIVKVPGGYYELYQCKSCEFKALTEEFMKKHVCQAPADFTNDEVPQASGFSVGADPKAKPAPSSSDEHQANPSISKPEGKAKDGAEIQVLQ